MESITSGSSGSVSDDLLRQSESVAERQHIRSTRDTRFDFRERNTNGGFAVDRHDGVEIGLRVKTRLPAPNDTPGVGLFSNGDGTYSHPAGDACPGFGFAPPPLCLATPPWSFDWSVNTNWDGSNPSLTLGQLTYQLGMDADPGPGTNFTLFDPISPSLIAPAFDHAMGNNGTTNGNGDTAVINYLTNLATENVAQNSWNYEFFNNIGTSLASFDPAVDGNYVIFLRAIDPDTNEVIAETTIQVLVGNAEAVPRRAKDLPKIKKNKMGKKGKKGKKLKKGL